MKHECFITKNPKCTMVSRYTFEGTSELADYIKKAETNQVWKGEFLSSNKEKEDGFNDFDSLEDTIQALEYGTDIYYDEFKKNVKKVKDFLSKREKNKNAKYKNDKVGFIPIVPKVIQGNPINMVNQDIKPKPYPTAKIILEKANSGGVNSNAMCEFYSIIFVLIEILEEKGIRCEIWITANSYERDDKGQEAISLKMKLKNYTQPLNKYKIQFPIIASDFHRRIFFRIKETDPKIKMHGWCWGYGCPLLTGYNPEDSITKEIIGIEEKDIYIPSCQEFKYKTGDDIEKTIEKIINETNLKNYIKLND